MTIETCLASVYHTHVPREHAVDRNCEINTFYQGLRVYYYALLNRRYALTIVTWYNIGRQTDRQNYDS